jgi:hypothetical protein
MKLNVIHLDFGEPIAVLARTSISIGALRRACLFAAILRPGEFVSPHKSQTETVA